MINKLNKQLFNYQTQQIQILLFQRMSIRHQLLKSLEVQYSRKNRISTQVNSQEDSMRNINNIEKYKSNRLKLNKLMPPIIFRSNTSTKHQRAHSQQKTKKSQQHKILQKIDNDPYSNIISEIKKAKLMKPFADKLKQLLNVLSFNSFFRKTGQKINEVLLKFGKIIFLSKENTLYTKGTTIKYLYIVLCGKLILKDKTMGLKKFVINSETLCQEILFQCQLPYPKRITSQYKLVHKQTAQAQWSSAILRIAPQKYYAMCLQMVSNGMKNQFAKIDNLFKINYINKNCVRKRLVPRRSTTLDDYGVYHSK